MATYYVRAKTRAIIAVIKFRDAQGKYLLSTDCNATARCSVLSAKLPAEQKERCVHVRRVDHCRDTESECDVSHGNRHLASIAVGRYIT